MNSETQPAHKCPTCGKLNAFVNQCGCDPNNMPTKVPNLRFVLNLGAIQEQYPDMPDQTLDGSVTLWDRQEKKPVFTLHAPYGQAICLEMKSDQGAPSAIEEWFNGLSNEALESEGIAPTKVAEHPLANSHPEEAPGHADGLQAEDEAKLQHYVEEEEGAGCPWCGPDADIEGGPVTIECPSAYQDCSCNDCNRTWRVIYGISKAVVAGKGRSFLP